MGRRSRRPIRVLRDELVSEKAGFNGRFNFGGSVVAKLLTPGLVNN
jgi:hypothetical protein